MKRQGFTLIEFLIVLGILAILAAVLWPTHLGTSRRYRQRAGCQSNLRQIALAFHQYSRDSSDYFPSLHATAGWREAVVPYLKDEAVFQCPGEENEDAPQTSDYWFNAQLSEVKTRAVKVASRTFLLGDGYSSGDPRTALSQTPRSWRDDENSPAWRHLGNANYAFVDGHVKSIHIRDVVPKPRNRGAYTFAVR